MDIASVIEPFEEWAHHRHHASAAPAAAAVTINQEDHMSLAADLHAAATRLETLGEESVTKLEAVAANPATAEAFDLLHELTGLGLDPSLISLAVGGLKAIVQAYTPPQPADPAQPAPAQ